jgi:hypothetical protein
MMLLQSCDKGFAATTIEIASTPIVPNPPTTPPATPPTTPPATPPVRPPGGPLVTAPEQPNEIGGNYLFYTGKILADPFYSYNNAEYQWSYSVRPELPNKARVHVEMHGSGGAEGVILWAYGSSDGATNYYTNPAIEYADLTVKNQDGEGFGFDFIEWWTSARDKINYPGRRLAGTLDFLKARYPQIDADNRGIIVSGQSMGGQGAVTQTMLMPEPWRSRIAYSTSVVGVIMPRRVHHVNQTSGQYNMFPPDDAANKAFWDSFDFAIQAPKDPVVRGIHYRGHFTTNDIFSAGPDGNTQTEFVNLLEENKIGGSFSWVSSDENHDSTEIGVNIPYLKFFENPVQDVTLDRAHPAITKSTGNFPILAADRVNEATHPRGHYNWV